MVDLELWHNIDTKLTSVLTFVHSGTSH